MDDKKSNSPETIYAKLQTMRVELQRMNIRKSGRNTYSNYDYFELSDFLPAINELMNTHKVCSVITFDEEEATLTLINIENPEEKIVFTSPMAEASLKGAHAIQNLGAVETYQRRYLYMTAFEVVENDRMDLFPVIRETNHGLGCGSHNREDVFPVIRETNHDREGIPGAAAQAEGASSVPRAAPRPAIPAGSSPQTKQTRSRAAAGNGGKISKDHAAAINAAIMTAKASSGLTIKEIVSRTESALGKKLTELTDADYEAAMAYIPGSTMLVS